MFQNHIGKTCPFCQFPIKQDSDIIVCPACKIPHHQDCWQSNDGCTTFACTGESGFQDDDLDIKLSVNFDEKEWLIMRAGLLKGPYSRSELLAPSFLEPADNLFNRFTQQWASTEDLTGSRLRSNETTADRLYVGSKQPILNLEHKKSVLGLASIIICCVSALGSFIVFRDHYLLSIFHPTLFIIIGLIALGLGIAGLMQKEQEKVLPAIGSVFSFLLIIAVMLQTGLNTTPSLYALDIPGIASGPSSGVTDTDYLFSASEISNAAGCDVEYCFAWGDGSESGWIMSNTAANTWTNAGNYQVRVKARCVGSPDTETIWSSPLNIIVEGMSINMPETPVLISPANNSIIPSKTIDFHWQPVDNADSYKIYVTRVSDNTAIVDQEVNNSSHTGSGFPDNGTEYQWTVCAGNSAGWSSWSTSWSFTNGSEPAPTPAPDPPPGSGDPPGGGTQPSPPSCTQQESEQIARQYVTNFFGDYHVSSIDLINVEKFDGEAEWHFSYMVKHQYGMAVLIEEVAYVTVKNCLVTDFGPRVAQ